MNCHPSHFFKHYTLTVQHSTKTQFLPKLQQIYEKSFSKGTACKFLHSLGMIFSVTHP